MVESFQMENNGVLIRYINDIYLYLDVKSKKGFILALCNFNCIIN